jgi:hypothetical protein
MQMNRVIVKMDMFIKEMCEEFLISEACSKACAYECQDSEAQNWTIFLKYMDHAALCNLACVACSKFLEDRNVNVLIAKLKELGFDDCVERIMDFQKKEKCE